MVSEPLVLVIKLADRLHNMRTVFALKRDKQKAVATETLQVWCSLAERLGMMVLKVRFFPLHNLAFIMSWKAFIGMMMMMIFIIIIVIPITIVIGIVTVIIMILITVITFSIVIVIVIVTVIL